MAAPKKYAGKSIVGTTVAVVNAGNSLSQSMAANGMVADGADEVELGGHYFLLMEVDAKGVRLDLAKETPNSLIAKMRLEAGVTMFVDKELAQPILAEQADRNEQARVKAEEAKGVYRFPTEDDEAGGPGGEDI